MHKSIFPTKVKDGLFVLTVAIVVMAGSLYVDKVKGVLRGEKLRVSIFLEGSAVEEQLTAGNTVAAFRRPIGKIDQVQFFAVEVRRLSEVGRANLQGIAGPREKLAKLEALQKSLAIESQIVTGVRLDALLYRDLIGTLMPLFGPKSEARITAAGMLGEPFLQLIPQAEGGGLKDGDLLGLPRNDVTTAPLEPLPACGTELLTVEEVEAAQKRIQEHKTKVKEFEDLLESIVSEAASAAPEMPSTGTVANH
ncbi:MAG: hypothetical protein HY814_14050 [Candidatus Riflebacteria bacterium]|nr:hypothetical protein [Candidatus Riflebacteria bacterium]